MNCEQDTAAVPKSNLGYYPLCCCCDKKASTLNFEGDTYPTQLSYNCGCLSVDY